MANLRQDAVEEIQWCHMALDSMESFRPGPGVGCARCRLQLGLSYGVGMAQVASASKSRAHVYLLRGAFNVFSLGLDDIADNLRMQGINVTVHNYLVWE